MNRPDLAIVPAELAAQVDALIAKIKPRRAAVDAEGSQRKRHLASSLVGCAVCSGGLTVSGSDRGGRSYVCTRHLQHGSVGCIGIGYRSEARVDEALTALARDLVSPRAMARAVARLRARLEARSDEAGRDGARRKLEEVSPSRSESRTTGLPPS